MTDIADGWLGFMQEEETDPTTPISEYLLHKFGSNINYLKAGADTIQGLITAYNSGVGLAVQIFSEYNVGIALNSPNGKNYFCGVIGLSQSGFLIYLTGQYDAAIAPVIHGNTTLIYYSGGGVPVYQEFRVSANTLVTGGGFTHEMNGAMLYQV